jgi:hypothetical protein
MVGGADSRGHFIEGRIDNSRVNVRERERERE